MNLACVKGGSVRFFGTHSVFTSQNTGCFGHGDEAWIVGPESSVDIGVAIGHVFMWKISGSGCGGNNDVADFPIVFGSFGWKVGVRKTQVVPSVRLTEGMMRRHLRISVIQSEPKPSSMEASSISGQ